MEIDGNVGQFGFVLASFLRLAYMHMYQCVTLLINNYCSIIQKRAGRGLIQVSECLGMRERMSLDLWRVHKWNQNLIFQNLQKVK